MRLLFLARNINYATRNIVCDHYKPDLPELPSQRVQNGSYVAIIVKKRKEGNVRNKSKWLIVLGREPDTVHWPSPT